MSIPMSTTGSHDVTSFGHKPKHMPFLVTMATNICHIIMTWPFKHSSQANYRHVVCLPQQNGPTSEVVGIHPKTTIDTPTGPVDVPLNTNESTEIYVFNYH